MSRYLIVLPRGADAYAYWHQRLSVHQDPAWVLTSHAPRWLLLSDHPPIAAGPGGAVVGRLHRGGGDGPVRTLGDREIGALREHGAQALIDGFWGDYVAVLTASDDQPSVLRAPFGNLPCYHSEVRGDIVVASDIDLLIRFAGYRPSINWEAVAAQLIAADIPRATTCLADVAELAGGDVLRFDAAARVSTVWSPWPHVARADRRELADVAAERVGSAVRSTVSQRIAGVERPVLLLSGGLDSSILAACLADAGAQCSALTMVTRDAGGDERGYARATARHLAMPLTEVLRDAAAIDIAHSDASGLPNPTARSFSQATMAAARRLAGDTAGAAIVHGGGGDNLFCALQSAAPIADLLRRRHIGPLRDTTQEIASLAQVTIYAVLRQAAARAWFRPPGYRWARDVSLLSRDVAVRHPEATSHPWLAPPATILPGAAAHVGLLVSAQALTQSFDPRAASPSIAMLVAQPIVEACLSVPSWLWFDRGCNRAVARRAFESRLPYTTAWRRSKGAMTSFMVEIYEAHRARIRPMLCDGRLVAAGLIDRAALAAALDAGGPTQGLTYARILQLADVEAWARSWR